MDEIEMLREKIGIWNKEHAYRANSLFTDRLFDAGFDETKIVHILEIINNTCPYCYDGDRGCQCWNDE